MRPAFVMQAWPLRTGKCTGRRHARAATSRVHRAAPLLLGNRCARPTDAEAMTVARAGGGDGQGGTGGRQFGRAFIKQSPQRSYDGNALVLPGAQFRLRARFSPLAA